jgi:hypothetical protein
MPTDTADQQSQQAKSDEERKRQDAEAAKGKAASHEGTRNAPASQDKEHRPTAEWQAEQSRLDGDRDRATSQVAPAQSRTAETKAAADREHNQAQRDADQKTGQQQKQQGGGGGDSQDPNAPSRIRHSEREYKGRDGQTYTVRESEMTYSGPPANARHTADGKAADQKLRNDTREELHMSPGDDVGHKHALDNNAPADDRKNVDAQNRTVNRGPYKDMEQDIRKYREDHPDSELTVNVRETALKEKYGDRHISRDVSIRDQNGKTPEELQKYDNVKFANPKNAPAAEYGEARDARKAAEAQGADPKSLQANQQSESEAKQKWADSERVRKENIEQNRQYWEQNPNAKPKLYGIDGGKAKQDNAPAAAANADPQQQQQQQPQQTNRRGQAAPSSDPSAQQQQKQPAQQQQQPSPQQQKKEEPPQQQPDPPKKGRSR